MENLHIVRTLEEQKLTNLKRYSCVADVALLIDDATYLIANAEKIKKNFKASTITKLFVIDSHVKSRGIQEDTLKELSDIVTQINFKQFVEMTLKAKKVINWS